jgi:hypothetical protein
MDLPIVKKSKNGGPVKTIRNNTFGMEDASQFSTEKALKMKVGGYFVSLLLKGQFLIRRGVFKSLILDRYFLYDDFQVV